MPTFYASQNSGYRFRIVCWEDFYALQIYLSLGLVSNVTEYFVQPYSMEPYSMEPYFMEPYFMHQYFMELQAWGLQLL